MFAERSFVWLHTAVWGCHTVYSQTSDTQAHPCACWWYCSSQLKTGVIIEKDFVCVQSMRRLSPPCWNSALWECGAFRLPSATLHSCSCLFCFCAERIDAHMVTWHENNLYTQHAVGSHCGQSRIPQAGWNRNRRTWDETWERFQGPWILLEGFGAKICNLHFKHTLKSVPGRQLRSALTLVAGGPRWWRDTFSFKAAHMHREWLHTRVQSGSFYCSPLSDPCLLSLSLSLWLCFYALL